MDNKVEIANRIFYYLLERTIVHFKTSEATAYQINNHIQLKEGHALDEDYLKKIRESITKLSKSFMQFYWYEVAEYKDEILNLGSFDKDEENFLLNLNKATSTFISKSFNSIAQELIGVDFQEDLKPISNLFLKNLGYTDKEFDKILTDDLHLLFANEETYIEQLAKNSNWKWLNEYVVFMGKILFHTTFLVSPNLACVPTPIEIINPKKFSQLFESELSYNKIMSLLIKNKYVTKSHPVIEWSPPCQDKYKGKHLSALVEVLSDKGYINKPKTKKLLAEIIKSEFDLNFDVGYLGRHIGAKDFQEVKSNYFFIPEKVK